ncbi:maleylpyruvate isomerase family mycothiol-dependent enzyme [Kribbella qitaiheensis]|uniref:Maleylpyruvate isomerase family mycothiol-dependent enzyme n=1 Tax=Kribbella qitaiheensis TaxID=1544730 RepID=A0A7G6X6D0_9ACTN|nr:maleylpyruvate isomerase family mycothiol-dependent enzyme [Kribbella qitaiheensis]QNE21795.1 maleylpyruvate isomerase family mycothiol-dependent enzyme [Kribbella qitaiheensis]
MSNADTVITALRNGHDGLAELVEKFSDTDLAGPSGATEWDISQVLSHLGSGAEIMTATVRAALDGTPAPDGDFNQSVWDRWNAASGRERADGFLEKNESLTALYESLDSTQRDELGIQLSWLPEPAEVATVARLRLNEFTLHAWDVRSGLDDKATLDGQAVPELLESALGNLSWISKPAALNGEYSVIQVTLTDPAKQLTLHLNDPVSISFDPASSPDGTLTVPAEAWLRLVSGRLAPQYTPDGVESTGAASLDTLRHVFAGY